MDDAKGSVKFLADFLRGKNFPIDFFLSQEAVDRFALQDIVDKLTKADHLKEIGRARVLIHQVNKQLDDQEALAPAEFTAIGLINEIFHYLNFYYRNDIDQNICLKVHKRCEKEIHEGAFAETIQKFLTQFFPLEPEYQKEEKEKMVAEILEDSAKFYLFFAESIHVDLFNENPAMKKYKVLYNNTTFKETSLYSSVKNIVENQFTVNDGIGKENKNFLDFLKEPQEEAPDSVYDQLDYIYRAWAYLLPDYLLNKILTSLDLLREENFSRGFFPPAGERDTFAPNYSDLDLFPEYEAFSSDKDWMPNVILLAKNAYVWLDQLSKKYSTEIKTLDQIPNQELDTMAHRGFTALWLIGLWQRSPASSRIKHLCGNPDAIASAYSIFEYSIDDNLGGEAAIKDLSQRCRARGIRLASDMVPNHMGVYSKWVIEHPEYFLDMEHCPFPQYQFNGENLSQQEDVGIYIEDGYYSRSDAAVVFKRVDFRNGVTRYIYHGNDGTSMPWNDTAQLDYLKPEVREAVMQQILRVAENFSIIRFDAAMTLTKKHIQRLWYPLPGKGGAIPTRSEFSKTADEFHAAIPNEFWREVVDRMAEQAPDTLLLAEAFWLLEGFFVRTLGMHRVYNSAFMNMLYKEENAKYRYLIKETLEFEPEILKRYTNFMTNPDEETAFDQFGNGDRYFGTALMMVTLPGLPMWGHGQVEGFHEKYGMEYSKAYYDEQEDIPFIVHHEHTIFPLMHKRYLFSGVENFHLFDFEHNEGYVDENVFAYTNRVEKEKALVVFNNRYADSAGYIRVSVAKLNKETESLQQTVLTSALDLHTEQSYFTIMRDQMSGLEYIRNNFVLHEQGLFVLLKGHQSHAFINIYEVYDADGHWRKIHDELNGQGVDSIEEFYRETRYKKIIVVIEQLLNKENADRLLQTFLTKQKFTLTKDFKEKALQTIASLTELVLLRIDTKENEEISKALSKKILENLEISFDIIQNEKRKQKPQKKKDVPLQMNLQQKALLLIFVSFLADLGDIRSPANSQSQSVRWFDEWVLYKRCKNIFSAYDIENVFGFSMTSLLRIAIRHKNWISFVEKGRSAEWVHSFFSYYEVGTFIRIHKYAGVTYFQKEQIELIFATLEMLSALHKTQTKANMQKGKKLLQEILDKSMECGYALHRLLEKFSIFPQETPKNKNKK